MEPQFQSSFIPKRPISTESSSFSASSHEPVSIFSLLANTLVTLTIFACIGLFGYTKILNSQITQIHTDIVSAKEVFQPDVIQSLINTSNKLSSAQRLLEKHTAPSEVFTALQALALKKVQFSDFTYTNKNNSVSINMQIETVSYNALAEQSKVFSGTSFILKPAFSDFKVLDKGNISAKFTAGIDPSLISYKKVLETGSVGQNGVVNQAMSATTTQP